MPIHIAAHALFEGIDSIPHAWTVLKTLPCLGLLYLLKTYFGGARNTSERNMHSKVVLMTGGTSGIGAAIAYGLAFRGAQLVLLTQQPLGDPFLVDYIMDLRTRANNELITAEQVDLTSLHSIRLFATKWVDNAPPRRLDMLVLCASTMTPKGSQLELSDDGVESSFAINYLANFHLLSILSPALRAQPPDRDVRIIFGTCSSYMGGQLPEQLPTLKRSGAKSGLKIVATNPSAGYAGSKLALMTFAAAFQKHLAAYSRPDKQPMNTRVLMVDPGWSRTPGMRRFLTMGKLWGLGLYLIMWPLWWLVLKSPDQGAQSFLYAAMDAEYGHGEGGKVLKECREVRIFRDEIEDEKRQQQLWKMSEKSIEILEKEGALRRAVEKKSSDQGDVSTATDGKGSTSASMQKTAGSRRSKKIK